MNDESSTTVTPRQYWRADRDSYRIEAAFRDLSGGSLQYRFPMSSANRWALIREVNGDPGEMPDRLFIAEFADVEMAEQVCALIEATAER